MKIGLRGCPGLARLRNSDDTMFFQFAVLWRREMEYNAVPRIAGWGRPSVACGTPVEYRIVCAMPIATFSGCDEDALQASYGKNFAW